MKVFKKALLIALVVLLLLVPTVTPFAVALSLPPVYDTTYFGALDEKYERLNSLDREKIVVIGGSSVAFGLDSKKLEEYTGMPVVNFGLYADLGTKMMLDLSLSGIGKGDIVVLSPELDPQTLSLYFNSRSALSAIDSDYSMLFSLPVGDMISCAASMWEFSMDKLERHRSDVEIELDSIYRSEYFNEYGDFGLDRPANIMPMGYDENNMISLTDEALDNEFLAFCDYLNKFILKCRLKGASVCFSYAPMNSLALTDKSAEKAEQMADRAEFCEHLEENIDCTFISSIDDYILDPGYFYDTNYHLNNAGALLRTIRLAKDIKLEYGLLDTVIKDSEPEAPRYSTFDPRFDGEDDPNSRFFTFSTAPNGAYIITGLTEEGKGEKILTLPLGKDGLKVFSIANGALDGAAVETLVIPEDSNIMIIANDALTGAEKLTRLEIYKMNASDIMPPAYITDVHRSFKIHVPIGSDYSNEYDWSKLGSEIFVYDLLSS